MKNSKRWTDDEWRRICQLARRLHHPMSTHVTLYGYISELEIEMGQIVHEELFIDERLKWLEHLMDQRDQQNAVEGT